MCIRDRLVVVLGVTITVILHFTTGTPITTMVGILSGAVTNTPGLGAAQQANSDLNGIDAPEIALGYAVSYPLGVEMCIRDSPSTYCTSKPSAYSGRMIREESEALTATPTACVLFLLFCPQETRNNKRQTTGQHFPFSRILLYLLIFYL